MHTHTHVCRYARAPDNWFYLCVYNPGSRVNTSVKLGWWNQPGFAPRSSPFYVLARKHCTACIAMLCYCTLINKPAQDNSGKLIKNVNLMNTHRRHSLKSGTEAAGNCEGDRVGYILFYTLTNFFLLYLINSYTRVFSSIITLVYYVISFTVAQKECLFSLNLCQKHWPCFSHQSPQKHWTCFSTINHSFSKRLNNNLKSFFHFSLSVLLLLY